MRYCETDVTNQVDLVLPRTSLPNVFAGLYKDVSILISKEQKEL